MEKTLSIALCTHNGAKYLAELLDSLSNQGQLPNELVVSDDASSDATLSILEDYRSRAPFSVRLLANRQRQGVIKNFETALSACTGDYIAPCDQDDVWNPDKLEKLVALVRHMETEPGHGPYFAHTDVELVDSNLNRMGVSYLEHQGLKPADFQQYRTLAVQNYIPGCSTLFTRDLLTYALPIPEAAVMHDWWLALLASMAGEIRYDPSRTVLYRQHGENVLGSEARFSMRTLRKIAAVKPALDIIEENFTASARQAIAATSRLTAHNVDIPVVVSSYIDSLRSSKLRNLASVISGKIGRANLLRNATLLAALLLYDRKSLQN